MSLLFKKKVFFSFLAQIKFFLNFTVARISFRGLRRLIKLTVPARLFLLFTFPASLFSLRRRQRASEREITKRGASTPITSPHSLVLSFAYFYHRAQFRTFQFGLRTFLLHNRWFTGASHIKFMQERRHRWRDNLSFPSDVDSPARCRESQYLRLFGLHDYIPHDPQHSQCRFFSSFFTIRVKIK